MILTTMNHPNVISMYEYFESPKYVTIIMEYFNGLPLLFELEKFKSDYTTRRITKILWQLSKAVRHLKAKDIIWCNFSHNNIIYDGEDVIICGFSRSRVKVKRDLKQAKSILGLRGTANARRPALCFSGNDSEQVLWAEARRMGTWRAKFLSLYRGVSICG